MIAFIDGHRNRWGVEPICKVLPIAPSTYYAYKRRPPSARALQDEELKDHILRVYNQNYRVYGADKIWAQLNREKIKIARCTVAVDAGFGDPGGPQGQDAAHNRPI